MPQCGVSTRQCGVLNGTLALLEPKLSYPPLVLAIVALTPSTMLETTAASVDKSIRASLLLLESSFFPSLRGGPEALAVFDHEITQFYEEVRQSEPYLKEETRLSIYSFVQMSSAVIPGLIDLDLTGEKIKLELQEGIDKVLDEALLTLSLDDTPFPGKSFS